VQERIRTIIEYQFSGNKAAFSRQIGVAATVIENVVGTRKGKPSYDVIEKICANANINPVWLLTGEGEMLRENNVSESSELVSYKELYEKAKEEIYQLHEQIGRLKAENESKR
jgi:hypothetical protein